MGIGIFVVAVALYVAIAAGSDFHMHRIPNYITVPTAILGLVYNAVAPTGTGVGLWGWSGSLAGFGMGFALLFFPWLLGGAGMGDVKLLAALGAWLGSKWLFFAFALSMLIACTLAVAVLLRNVVMRGVGKAKKKFSDALELTGDMGKKKRTRRVVPFAVPVALGTWLVLTWLVYRAKGL